MRMINNKFFEKITYIPKDEVRISSTFSRDIIILTITTILEIAYTKHFNWFRVKTSV